MPRKSRSLQDALARPGGRLFSVAPGGLLLLPFLCQAGGVQHTARLLLR